MGRKTHWEELYSTRAPDEVSWYEERPEASLRLIKSSGVGPQARVIDVGGGASRLVDTLLEEGFSRVTVLDVAQGPIEQVRERLGSRADEIEWIVADITAFEPPHRWDLWHDRAVFHFLTDPDDRAGYRRALEASLVPGGQAIVATFALSGPERCSGFPVVRYSAETLGAELGEDYGLLEATEELHPTPGGAIQPFTYARFRRLDPASR